MRSSSGLSSSTTPRASSCATTSLEEGVSLGKLPRTVNPKAAPFERLMHSHLQSVSSLLSFSGMSSEGAFEDSLLQATSWSEEMPQAILFPANKPSSRADAAVLDQWLTHAFVNYAQRCQHSHSRGSEEQLAKAVEELIPILSIGLQEIVRQVTQHCLERGVVLEKIWRTYVELFERALAETRTALKKHKERTTKVEGALHRTRRELNELKAMHPEQIQKLSDTLAGKFAQRQEELEDQLQTLRAENSAMRKHIREQGLSIETWFPQFESYKDSPFRKQLTMTSAPAVSNNTADHRLAADFKRILSVMTPESRRRVSYYVSSLLGLRGVQLPQDSAEALYERREINRAKIEQLEARLAELQETGDAFRDVGEEAQQPQRSDSFSSVGEG